MSSSSTSNPISGSKEKAMYTVWMTNFNMSKGEFANLDHAISHAKSLGFECHITFTDSDMNTINVMNIRPY